MKKRRSHTGSPNQRESAHVSICIKYYADRMGGLIGLPAYLSFVDREVVRETINILHAYGARVDVSRFIDEELAALLYDAAASLSQFHIELDRRVRDHKRIILSEGHK